MRRTRPSRYLLDATCPIEWSHPFNRGLLHEWTVPPLTGWAGGGTMRDLVRGGKNPSDGTLNGSGVAFKPATHAGGFGSIGGFTSTSGQFVAVGNQLISNLANSTVAAWVNTTDTTTSSRSIYCERAASGNDIWKFEKTDSSPGNFLELTHRDDAGSLDQLRSTSLAINDGKWHFCVQTKLGTAINFYMDGALTGGSPFTQGGSDTLTNAGLVSRIGGDAGDNTASWTGSLDGVLLWNRALPAKEVVELNNEAHRGNPERWRWVKRIGWFLPPATGTIPNKIVEVNQSITTAVY